MSAALRLPPIGLGCAALGIAADGIGDEDAVAALRAALAGGIAYLDTAPLYGGGRSERRIGWALADWGGERPLLSTKVGYRLNFPEGSRPAEGTRERDYSADLTIRSVRASLARLGVERVDLVLIHDPEGHEAAAAEQCWPALARLRDAGLVGAIGIGVNESRTAIDMLGRVELDAVLIAGRYTLLDRSAADGLFPACASRGVPVIVGGVLNSGILAGGAAATYDYAPAPAAIVERARALARLCAGYGVPLAAAALQFPRRHAAVTTTLLGPKTARELAACLELLDWPIPEGLWAALAAAGDAPATGGGP